MSKLLAIACSDFHVHKFKQFNHGNSRLENTISAITEIYNYARERDIPILFAGDFYHDPQTVENETNYLGLKTLKQLSKHTRTYAISGNHDLSQRNGKTNKSPSHLNIFEHLFLNFRLVDSTIITTYDFLVAGVPYMDNEVDLRDAIVDLNKTVNHMNFPHPKILLLHTDWMNAKTCTGITIGEMEYLNKRLIEDWDWVICGHIHKPQVLGSNIIMCGSPIHQNAGDEGVEMGFWEIYNDKVVFIPLNKYPHYKTLTPTMQKNDKDYYIEQGALLVVEKHETGEFTLDKSKKKLATKYCDMLGINNRAKRKALIEILNRAE